MARYTAQYHVACQIQKKILAKLGIRFQEANRVPKSASEDCDLNPKDLALLVSSWNTIESQKRILRGRGLPKPVESKEREKKPTRAVFTE
jgi:hypothetical protein